MSLLFTFTVYHINYSVVLNMGTLCCSVCAIISVNIYIYIYTYIFTVCLAVDSCGILFSGMVSSVIEYVVKQYQM